jgi:hypothetical protein
MAVAKRAGLFVSLNVFFGLGRQRMHLWLNCEGWVRFGPYEWLRFDDTPRAIRDQDNRVVATFDDGSWIVPE